MDKNIIKNKSAVLAAGVFFLFAAVVGGVIAFSQDSTRFNNEFKLAGYRTLFTESFDSPSNWITCETIDKTITVTNESESDVSVRLRFEEEWIASDGTTRLPLISASSNLDMAQIEFVANSGWTKRGEYYYYDSDLANNATTTSPIMGVTLNCNANLSPNASLSDSDYADATYHLRIIAETAESEIANPLYLYDVVANQVNNLDGRTIDFAKAAKSTNDISLSNGNGVDTYMEKGQTIYYFRGEVDNNNVLWADKCWKMLRTTYSGGVKMIYAGKPSDVLVDGETEKQCSLQFPGITEDGASVSTYQYGDNGASNSLPYVGYMYGEAIDTSSLGPGVVNRTMIFSNNISRNNDTYTLDTTDGQSITGTWANDRATIATRYHYFCTDGQSVCDSTKIGYITDFYNVDGIHYIKVGGYDNIETIKAAAFENKYDSGAKKAVDSWFNRENLDGHIAGTRNYEDDLEDAIFCNDRSFYSGSLKGIESDGLNPVDSNYYNAWERIDRLDNHGTIMSPLIIEPSLDCMNKNDAFTKDDSINGNAKLSYKVGLATADELTLSGSGQYGYSSDSYTAYAGWTMTPSNSGSASISMVYYVSYNMGDDHVFDSAIIRPVVSLKPKMKVIGGNGLKTNPYTIELEQ